MRLTGRAFRRLPEDSSASYRGATTELQERFEPKSKKTRYQTAIDTGDARPITQPVRRVSPQQREDYPNGIVGTSTSPWASPIVLVRKKDGSTRFYVDYRRVNGVTRKDAYRLSRIDTALDALVGLKWFSTLDLLSGKSRSTRKTVRKQHFAQLKGYTSPK